MKLKEDRYLILFYNLKYLSVNNVNKLYNLLTIIKKNKNKKIILKCKTEVSKEYLYFLTEIHINKLSFKLFESIQDCLKEKNNEANECLWLYFYLEPYHSILHWINSKHNNCKKNGDILMRIVDNFNKYFNVPYCLLSDEAKINYKHTCIDLSISYIFKYGNTYYEKYDFCFDVNIYNTKTNLKIINNEQHYLEVKQKLKQFDFDKIISPLYKLNQLYFNSFINKRSVNLGDIMKDIIKNDITDYREILQNIIKYNKTINYYIDIIKDAKTCYIKKYSY